MLLVYQKIPRFVIHLRNSYTKGTVKRHIFLAILIVSALVLGVGLAYFFDRVPTISTVTLPAELSRGELSEVLGDALRWSAKERNEFMAAHTRMQWMEFSAPLADVLTKKFSWKDAEREVFLISSERYTFPHLDVLRGLYASGVYVISAKEATPALVAGVSPKRP